MTSPTPAPAGTGTADGEPLHKLFSSAYILSEFRAYQAGGCRDQAFRECAPQFVESLLHDRLASRPEPDEATIQLARAKCLEVERTFGSSELSTKCSLAASAALRLADLAPCVRHHVEAIHALADYAIHAEREKDEALATLARQLAREQALRGAAGEYLRCDDVGGNNPSHDRAMDTQRARTALRALLGGG